MRLNIIKLHVERVSTARNTMHRRHFWRMDTGGKLACALALLLLMTVAQVNPAYALGLGRVKVQSTLGEVLRAEVDVPEITAEEAASLRVDVAPIEVFKAAGLDYSATVTDIQVSLQKRADGRSFLRLSSSRPVTEPFVDLILEANWATGRVRRDYTMLFDPPNLRQTATDMAQVAPQIAPALSSPVPAAGTVNPPSSPAAQTKSRPDPATSAKSQPESLKGSQPVVASRSSKVAVKPGDTAGNIAAQNKPTGISLDQMLVALLRGNPNAFMGGNVNRLKSGAVLDIPSAEEAGALSAAETSSTLRVQAKDFNDFRQKLASAALATQVDSATRKAGGKVQAKVEDRAPVAATPDKLTLSKGAVQGKAIAEDKIAKDKQAKDASNRVAELAKNIGDLNKIAATPSAAPTVATPASTGKLPIAPSVQITAVPGIKTATPSVPTSPVSVTTPTVTVSAISTTSVSTFTTTSTSALTLTTVVPTASMASAPVVAAPVASAPTAVKKSAAVPPPPPPEPSLIDELTNNPLALPGLGLLLALLAGLGFYRYKKRNDHASVDSSFLESRLQPDSFFDASGGQRVDTREGNNAAGSSLMYSPSQLDAAGDVDPVAEADVYLAYGRDLQAEEILKEALRTNPTRMAIHAKLMEIYAKRHDLKGFEVIAADAFILTRGNGPEWAYICELGRDLDPTNALYKPGEQPDAASVVPNMAASLTGTVAAIPKMQASQHEAAASSVDFDLDLDFSANHESLKAAASIPTAVPDLSPRSVTEPIPVYAPEPPAVINLPATPQLPSNSLSFSLDSLPVFSVTVPSEALAVVSPVAPERDNSMLAFDMDSLSLELDAPITDRPTLAAVADAAPSAVVQSPLETKFALAEEFRALGDSDGARSLANEVVAQADGALKSKAQAFINALP